MTNAQFDNASFHKGQKCLLHGEIVGVNFERRTFVVRVTGRKMPVSFKAADVTIGEE